MKHYLSMCAIVKNEEKYIREWLQFHRCVGFEHFYMYENESTDRTKSVLAEEMSIHNDITLTTIPGCPAQFRAYQDCLAQRREESRWIAFMDADEFLVPSIGISLHAFLPGFEPFPALGIHWYLFGSNGHKVYTPFPVIERFTRRQPDVNPHIKCIVNPKLSFTCHTAHLFTHSSRIVDEHKNLLPYLDPIPKNGTCDLLQINHYAVKSYEECLERRNRPRTDTGEIRQMPEMFNAHDRNEVEDLKAYDIWKQI